MRIGKGIETEETEERRGEKGRWVSKRRSRRRRRRRKRRWW